MHVAEQLDLRQFAARVGGRDVPPDQLLPGWAESSRFGIVVTTPLGGLGASLLIQLAIARFYDVRPTRRNTTPAYPEIYLFHSGGPHGDFSNFDFWPPRKEVRLRGRDPVSVLEALNSHAITHLALPHVSLGDPAVLARGPSSWAEQGSALDRLGGCFLYSPDGTTPHGDIELTSDDPQVRENVEQTLDPVPGAQTMREGIAHSRPVLAGPSVLSDGLNWADEVDRRAAEISPDARRDNARSYSAALVARGGRLVEIYLRISPLDALSAISALAP